ncbi:hypothetical protein Tco_1070694 [Tanacetum coccineum]|uniref:Uncharacterized protein n=1 Tax=Tanacetum coccineum TaxID=301880 RepID=A0ABQ5HNY3_9ASTR
MFMSLLVIERFDLVGAFSMLSDRIMVKISAGFALKKGRKNLARKSNRKTKILVSVPDDRYAVSNGSGYAVLICWVNTLYWTENWIRRTNTSYLLDGYDDYTTNQFDDDKNVRLNEPVDTDKGFIQKEATNPPSTLLNFTSVFQFDNRVTTLEKEVVEIKRNDPLNTQVTALVDEHLDSILGATRDEFMSYLSASITSRITDQVKSQLPQILPKEVSNFAPSLIKSMVTESLERVVLAKESSQPKSIYEAASSLTEFELKKILIITPYVFRSFYDSNYFLNNYF